MASWKVERKAGMKASLLVELKVALTAMLRVDWTETLLVAELVAQTGVMWVGWKDACLAVNLVVMTEQMLDSLAKRLDCLKADL